MNAIITVIVTLLIFGALIALHELGHYIAARCFRVGIREYSIGMGPVVYQRKGKYNKFSLRALPIGGFVDMVGENPGDDISDPEDEGKIPLNSIAIWKRMVIVLAGPLVNIVLGLLIMAIIVLFQSNLYGTTVDRFGGNAISDNNMVYFAEGNTLFEKNDIIYAADGKVITAENGIDEFLAETKDTKEYLVIRKNSTEFTYPAPYTVASESFGKFSLTELDGFVCLSEDFVNSKGETALQKNDIIYSIQGVLVKSADQAAELAKRHTTEDGNIENVLIIRRFGTAAAPIIVTTDTDLGNLSPKVSGALMEGDEIREVGSTSTRVYADLSYGIFNEGIEPVDITVIRDGKKQVVENVVFFKGSEQGVVYGEVDFVPADDGKSFGNVCYNAVFQPLSSLKMTLDSLVSTFSGRYGMEALSGPVGIGEQIGEVIHSGSEGSMEVLFTLIVMITLSLGVCNLLPLPVLDGGRFLLYIIEGIRRKPLPPKVETAIMSLSMLFVLGLMAIVMFKDIWGLF